METGAKKPLNRWQLALLHLAIVGVALAGVVATQRSQLNRSSQWTVNPQQAEQQEALRLQLLQKTPTLGYDNLIANWTFLSFLQYYGDDVAREQTGYSLSPQFFDIITRRDPRFTDIYLFLSGTLSYELGQPQLAVDLMKRGTDALSPEIDPGAFRVWHYRSLDQLLLLGDTRGAIHSLEMASQWAAAVPTYRETAPLFQRTADFLKRDPDSKLVRFQAWGTVFNQAQQTGDRKTQDRARQELLALGGLERVTPDGVRYFTLPMPVKASPQKPKPTK
ncbi:MAG: hypothetical protein HC780_12410 [Leptolyngbyaceae cyanobacterium CSU_1_3]|nr:hypothetical protein [Leptolyngbyaceae cyanobacterium CSU_1_3]